MAKIPLTKQQLRFEEGRLKQLKQYLPTLQMKKALLQQECVQARLIRDEEQKIFEKKRKDLFPFSPLFQEGKEVDIAYYIQARQVQKRYENIVGVEAPIFEGVLFPDMDYYLFSTPIWSESVIFKIRDAVESKEKIHVIEERVFALEKELHEVSVRVNLFEKVLIPRTLENIRKIRIFLSDLSLAAVAQAKITKKKLEAKSVA